MMLFLSLSISVLQSFIPAVSATTGCNAIGWDDIFNDVLGCTLYQPAITWMADEGIAEGVADPAYPQGPGRLFQPARAINRAEFTKIVLIASGEPTPLPACTKAPFPDVPVNAWFAPYVCRAKELGIISGFPDGTFKPGISINFVNGAKILAHSFDVSTDPADAQFSEEENLWFRPYTEALRKQGITAPSIEKFDSNLTRGEMAEMLYRVVTSKSSFDPNGEPDQETVGMGYGPYDLEGPLGMTVTEPDPPFAFYKTSRTITGVFTYPLRAEGYVFAHALPVERCGLSGMFQHCVPMLRDWQIGFWPSPVPYATLAKQMKAYASQEFTTKTFGGKEGTCIQMGVEGENVRFCVVPITAKKSLVITLDYIDSSVVYSHVPGVTALAKIEEYFDRIADTMWFAPQQ